MRQSSSQAACLRLEGSWRRKDVADCTATLQSLLASPADPAQPADTGPILRSLAGILRGMVPSQAGRPDDADMARFADLRADLLRRAGAIDADLRFAFQAEEIATRTEPREWAAALFGHTLSRGQAVGRRRDGLWQDVAFVQWSIGQLVASCTLDEAVLRPLLGTLGHCDMQLTWEIAGSATMRSVMQAESNRLRAALMAQVGALARAGGLRHPEAFIPYDGDGSLLPALAAGCVDHGPRDVNDAALLFFLARRGAVGADDFIARVAHQPIFLVSDDRFVLSAGEAVPFPLCRPAAQQEDGRQRDFHLAWWLNVNFPREQLGHPEHLATRLPFFVRQLLVEGAATLVLNASGEASWFAPDWLDQMAALATTLGIRPEQVVYLPQNTRFVAQAQAARKTRHPGAATRVAPLNQHLVYSGWRREPEAAQPRKRFLCFNQRAHLHRTALMLLMRRDGLLADAHLSFNQAIGSEVRLDGTVLAPWMALPPAEIDAMIAGAADLLPLRLDLAGTGLADAVDGDYVSSVPARLFADAALYLVTETEMEAGAMCRVTEKTVKGLAAEIPFLVFGNHGALAALRELGFRTFAPLIDEGYDAILDPALRFQAAYAEVRRLAAMPMQEVMALRAALRPALVHNRQHLLGIGLVLHDRLAPRFAAAGQDRSPAGETPPGKP